MTRDPGNREIHDWVQELLRDQNWAKVLRPEKDTELA